MKKLEVICGELSMIKQLRLSSGMTQKAFGEYLGIPTRTIQSWEIGERQCQTYLIDLIEYKLLNEGKIKEVRKVKAEKLEIIRVHIDDEFYVDIQPGEEQDFWLYRKGYGEAVFMFGIPTEPEDKAIQIAELNAYNFIDKLKEQD